MRLRCELRSEQAVQASKKMSANQEEAGKSRRGGRVRGRGALPRELVAALGGRLAARRRAGLIHAGDAVVKFRTD